MMVGLPLLSYMLSNYKERSGIGLESFLSCLLLICISCPLFIIVMCLLFLFATCFNLLLDFSSMFLTVCGNVEFLNCSLYVVFFLYACYSVGLLKCFYESPSLISYMLLFSWIILVMWFSMIGF